MFRIGQLNYLHKTLFWCWQFKFRILMEVNKKLIPGKRRPLWRPERAVLHGLRLRTLLRRLVLARLRRGLSPGTNFNRIFQFGRNYRTKLNNDYWPKSIYKILLKFHSKFKYKFSPKFERGKLIHTLKKVCPVLGSFKFFICSIAAGPHCTYVNQL
jgi:hypothetical protein